MNRDLVVVFDHWLTPTAQLADFVLPADCYLEREDLRQIPALRKISPMPKFYLNPVDCERFGVEDGTWAWTETTHGRVAGIVRDDAAQPEGSIRLPHGWCYPELETALGKIAELGAR